MIDSLKKSWSRELWMEILENSLIKNKRAANLFLRERIRRVIRTFSGSRYPVGSRTEGCDLFSKYTLALSADWVYHENVKILKSLRRKKLRWKEGE